MTRIKINGEWFSEVDGLKEGVVRAYGSLLLEPPDWRSNINALVIKVLGTYEAE